MLAARKVAGCRPKRAAFTLVEMLIALAILLVLSTLLIGFGGRMMESRRSNSGADLLQKWLLIAKQRALRDQTPTGLRLIAGTGGLVNQLVYVQQPRDLSLEPATISFTKSTVPGPGHPPPYDVVDLAGAIGSNDFWGPFGMGAYQNVQIGDYLQINGGRLNRVVAVPKATTLNILNTPTTGGTTPPDASHVSTSQFVIVRSSRPLQGEDPLQLPQDVAIDTTTNSTYGNALPTDPFTEIIFGPDGRVIGPGTTTGKIILWVRDVTQLNAEQSLIVIYTRTGFIASHPVDTTPGAINPYSDPYSFTRDGRTSGS